MCKKYIYISRGKSGFCFGLLVLAAESLCAVYVLDESDEQRKESSVISGSRHLPVNPICPYSANLYIYIYSR